MGWAQEILPLCYTISRAFPNLLMPPNMLLCCHSEAHQCWSSAPLNGNLGDRVPFCAAIIGLLHVTPLAASLFHSEMRLRFSRHCSAAENLCTG